MDTVVSDSPTHSLLVKEYVWGHPGARHHLAVCMTCSSIQGETMVAFIFIPTWYFYTCLSPSSLLSSSALILAFLQQRSQLAR